MKINSSKIFKNFIPWLIILLNFAFIVFTLYFIYKNVLGVFSYTTPKENLVAVDFDINLFRKIQDRMENKKNIKNLNIENLKNPFILTTPPTPEIKKIKK